MASANDKIRDVLQRYGEAFTEGQGGNVWRVQGTPVISHRCLERIAAQAGIAFELPTILRSERDEAVILVAGSLDKRREWSIGEAVINVNYRVSGKQAAYVYAMAEKRAKDRVILKLVELHGLAYSEEEADDFRQRSAEADRPIERPARPARSGDPADRAEYEATKDERNAWWAGEPTASQRMAREMSARLWRVSGEAAVKLVIGDEQFRQQFRALDEEDRNRLGELIKERRAAQ
jgi:hypothetical protein